MRIALNHKIDALKLNQRGQINPKIIAKDLGFIYDIWIFDKNGNKLETY